jgi:hypothetical protein
MKLVILLAGLVCVVSADAQSLKEALYSGKLKLDTGTVIRKGDDLSSKIDTSRKLQVVEPPKTASAPMTLKDSSGTLVLAPSQPDVVTATPGVVSQVPVNISKDNNKIWKDYVDELTNTLRAEVLTSKKLKDGSYSVLIEYEIGLDGQIGINNVTSSPENSFLEQQVKDRLILGAPTMNPVLAANGKPRKVARRQMITLTK